MKLDGRSQEIWEKVCSPDPPEPLSDPVLEKFPQARTASDASDASSAVVVLRAGGEESGKPISPPKLGASCKGSRGEGAGISEEFDYDVFMQRYGASAIPLFIVHGPGDVVICTVAKPLSPKLGHTLMSLVDPNHVQSWNYPFACTVLVEGRCRLAREPVVVVDLEGEVRAYPLQIFIRSTTGLVAENAASSPISVRRKQHMYSIETPEAKPAPSTFRDPVIPESTDAQTGAAGDASGVTTAGSMVGDLLDSRLNNL